MTYLHKYLFRTAFLLLLPTFLPAQGHQPVFPDLGGAPLIQALRDAYRPAFVLDFADARDTLFARVYARQDTLTCVYSGHQLYLNPDADPTQAAYQNGALWGINTEHTWPRAKGADDGNPRADMHHLHPTRIAVNAARANSPFLEIDDQQTDEWFYLTFTQFSIPQENIDLYSEATDSAFEPREDHKGNVARAMFYFYTMYRQEADAADPDFFGPQRLTLCQWHYQDPVDQLEWDRTWQIAAYQDGKANPFVLDCTLPARSYCEDVDLNCVPVSAAEPEPKTRLLKLDARPNPFYQDTRLDFTLPASARVQVELFDPQGRRLGVRDLGQLPAGEQQFQINTSQWPDLPAGLLFCRLRVKEPKRSYSQFLRLLLLP